MKALRNVSAKYWFNLGGQETSRVMAAKMLALTQNINTNKQNQLKITKETLISNFVAVVCVYLYTGLPLV